MCTRHTLSKLTRQRRGKHGRNSPAAGLGRAAASRGAWAMDTSERHDLRYISAAVSLGRDSRPRAAGAVYTTPTEAHVAPVGPCNGKSHATN